MSIEDDNSKKLEQQKLEQQEKDKPKTGDEALDIVQAQKEEKDINKTPETSTEQTKTGEKALDIVQAQRQEQKLTEAQPLGKLEPKEVRRTSEGSIIMCNEVKEATDRRGIKYEYRIRGQI